MSVESLMKDAEEHMKKSLHVLEEELGRVSTGRATPALIEDVEVNYYGTPTPLKHMANITAPEANLIVIRPFDPNQRQPIEKAIQEANLGFNPVVAEDVVRIQVPPLSEDRRNQMVRLVHERGEEAKVAVRNIRRHTKEALEKLKEEGELPEDYFHRELQNLDDLTHKYCDDVDGHVAAKDKQLKTV
jgi:ribosome recycling factor